MNGWQDWLTLSGFVLTFVGLAITLVGIDNLSQELFHRRPLPHRRVGGWLKRTLRRRQRAKASIVAASLSGEGRATGRLQGVRAQPAPDAPQSDWVVYWDSRLANLSERIDWANEDIRTGREEARVKIDHEESERRRADDEVERKLGRLLGGENGSGLVMAWWGIVMAVVGAALQTAAAIGAK